MRQRKYPHFVQKVTNADLPSAALFAERYRLWTDWASKTQRVTCVHCNGSGYEPIDHRNESTCSVCAGDGWITEHQAATLTWTAEHTDSKGVACTI